MAPGDVLALVRSPPGKVPRCSTAPIKQHTPTMSRKDKASRGRPGASVRCLFRGRCSINGLLVGQRLVHPLPFEDPIARANQQLDPLVASRSTSNLWSASMLSSPGTSGCQVEKPRLRPCLVPARSDQRNRRLVRVRAWRLGAASPKPAAAGLGDGSTVRPVHRSTALVTRLEILTCPLNQLLNGQGASGVGAAAHSVSENKAHDLARKASPKSVV